MGVRGPDAGRLGRPIPRGTLRGRDVAAIAFPAGELASHARVGHLRRRRQRRRDHREGGPGRREGGQRALRRPRCRTHGRARRSERTPCSASGRQRGQGSAARQRTGHVELQRAEYPRPGGRQGVLRRGVRVGHRDRRGRWDEFTFWRLQGYGDFLASLDPECASGSGRAERRSTSRTPSPGFSR